MMQYADIAPAHTVIDESFNFVANRDIRNTGGGLESIPDPRGWHKFYRNQLFV